MRHRADQFAGVHLVRQVLRNRADDRHAMDVRGPEYDDRRLPLVAQGIGQGAHLHAVETLHLHRQNMHALNFPSLGFQRPALRLRHFILQLLNLLFQAPLIGQHLFNLFKKIGFRRLNRQRHATQCGRRVLKPPYRGIAGDGFNPARTRADGAFINDLAKANIARAGNVRAAAEFLAESGDVNHANLFAVLLAE